MKSTQKLIKAPKNAGFTLIELLVTTAITSIILLTASTILMTFFLSNTRTSIRRQLKSEGARALARIEFIARGAQNCTDTGNVDITFTNLDNSTVRVWAEDVSSVRNIRMTTTPFGGSPTTENLLSQFAEVDTANFLLDCVRETPTASKLYASVRFQLATPGTTTVVESFSTLAVLRNSQ